MDGPANVSGLQPRDTGGQFAIQLKFTPTTAADVVNSRVDSRIAFFMPRTDSLAHRCRTLFTGVVKARGEQYAREARVTLDVPSAHRVAAEVRGSGIQRYTCVVDWQDAHKSRLIFDCTCPAFMSDGPCKHLWAMLQTMDAQGLSGIVGGGARLLEARDLHDLDDEDADDIEDLEEVGDDDSDVETDKSSAAKAFEANVLPSLRNQWPTDPHGAARPQAKPILAKSGQGKPGRAKPGQARIPDASPQWLRTLAPVTATERRQQAIAQRSKKALLWFVLNLQISERKDAFVIEFFRGGSEGKALAPAQLKPTRLSEQSLDEMETDERALVEMLLHRPATDGLESYSMRRGWEQFSQAIVTGDLCALLLPRLVRSGRFILRESTRAWPDPHHPVHMNEQPPLRLHLHMLERPASWLLAATLVQEQTENQEPTNRAWPLATADLVLSSGYALREHRLFAIEMRPGARQWLEILRNQNSIEVPHRDRASLLEFISSYSGEVPLHLPAALRLTECVGTPQPCLRLKTLESFDGRNVEATLTFDYAGRFIADAERPAAWIDEGERNITRRDFVRERAHRDELTDLGAVFVRGVDTPAGQVSMELRLTVARLIAVVSELAAKQWRVELRNKRMVLASSSEWSISSGVDWFELQGGLQFGGANAELPELLKALRRGENFVALADGSTGIIPDAWLARLETIARLGSPDGEGVRFKPAQALLLEALLAERANEQIKARTDTQYRQRLNELRDGEKSTAIDPPASFQGELRPYQREGLGWFQFLQRLRIGGCLADDMGLGKTVQVLALLEARRLAPKHKSSIVVVPKSLVFNWQQEAARFTPQLRVLAYVGAGRQSLIRQLRTTDVVLTTYATLLRDIAHIKDIQFDYAILDEAQAIKNDASQSAKACRLLNADHRLAMSGTPVENHLGELWSLFEFLNPGLLGSIATFRSLSQIDSVDDLEALQRALRPFILRRTKAQVLTDLPEKSEQTLLCELSPKERRNYDQLLDHYRATLLAKVRQTGIKHVQIHVLEALLRLRQAALHPGLLSDDARHDSSAKFSMLMEQLEDVLPQGHKALVFSQFTGLLALLREKIDARGWDYAYLDGKTRDREAVVRSFQDDPNRQLFLISLRAGGQGLNLTAADYVFILDPWWNPAVEAQAIDRAHRIGQNRAVFAYRLIAADTIEQKIVELQSRKRELAEAIITAENAAPSALTAEDLELLLS